MHSTCLHCTKDLGQNEVIETLPIGRRVAFDAAQGRLWVVCRHCAKWNLVPFDTRLESIDACERLYRDTKTRYATDNIGLARVKEGLELVRIGQPLRPEFASWRYGEQYKRRRRRNQLLAGGAAGLVVAGFIGLGAAGVVSGGAFWYMAQQGTQSVWDRVMNNRRRVLVGHPATSDPLRLDGWSSHHATLAWDGDGEVSLVVPVEGAMRRIPDSLTWTGAGVRSVGRRMMASTNLTLGSNTELAEATTLLSNNVGDLSAWARHRVGSQGRFLGRGKWDKKVAKGSDLLPAFWDQLPEEHLILGRLLPHERLAVEMWLSEDAERIWLEGELKLLEREWKESERLAKIADDLALPPEVSDQLLDRKGDA